MYLHFVSFLHTEMPVKILPHIRPGLFYLVNNMVADVLVTQGAKESSTMILT